MLRPPDFNPNTIPEMLCRRATHSAHDVAYCFPERAQTCTWAELWTRVRQLAEGLHHLGIRKGDRVAVLMEGSTELIQTLLAAAAVGATVMPLNTYSKPEELQTYFLDAGPAAFILDADLPHLPLTSLPPAAAWLPPHVFVHGAAPVPAPFRPYAALLAAAPLPDVDFRTLCRATQPHEPAFLLYTSGSTGVPKGVLRSTASFLPAGAAVGSGVGHRVKAAVTRLSDRYTRKFAVMSLLPLYHLGGIGLLFTSLKVSNVRTVMLAHFNPVRALAAVEQERCKFLIGTPFMIQALLATGASHPAGLDSVLGLVFTSSAVNGAILERIVPRLRNLYFFTVSYGSSEAGAVANGTCLVSQRGNLLITAFLKLLRSAGLLNGLLDYADFAKTPYSICGKVDKAVEVRVADPATGVFLPPGQEGEIMIRSHRVMRYTHRHLTEESFLPEGWYRSGDLGYLNAQDHLIISGRLKRLISRGGEKISPVEIENVLLQHPAIAEVFVVGVPDGLYGEQICAAYVPQPGTRLDVAQLKADLAGALSAFKIPRYFVALPALPLSAAGKLAGAEIKELVMAQLSEN